MDEACRHERVVKGPGGLVCAHCGVAADGAAPAALAGPRTFIDIVGVDQRSLAGMGVALVIAIVVQAYLPFVAYVTRMLGCLAHEIGHAVVGWALVARRCRRSTWSTAAASPWSAIATRC